MSKMSYLVIATRRQHTESTDDLSPSAGLRLAVGGVAGGAGVCESLTQSIGIARWCIRCGRKGWNISNCQRWCTAYLKSQQRQMEPTADDLSHLVWLVTATSEWLWCLRIYGLSNTANHIHSRLTSFVNTTSLTLLDVKKQQQPVGLSQI